MTKVKTIEELQEILSLDKPMTYNDKYIFSLEGLAQEIFKQNLKYKNNNYILKIINKSWKSIPIQQLSSYEKLKEDIYNKIHEGCYYSLREIGCKFTRENFDKNIYSFIDTITKDTLIEQTIDEYDISLIIKDIFRKLSDN